MTSPSADPFMQLVLAADLTDGQTLRAAIRVEALLGIADAALRIADLRRQRPVSPDTPDRAEMHRWRQLVRANHAAMRAAEQKHEDALAVWEQTRDI